MAPELINQSNENSSIIIILVRPQLPENIGAAARVMKNFGFGALRLISPLVSPTDPKAYAISAGADDILNKAQVFSDLSCAIEDLIHVFATGAQSRELIKPVYTLESGIQNALPAISSDNIKVGILFGPERTGLTNDDFICAKSIWQIPTQPDFSSLNLAQAIAITLYEIDKQLAKIEKQSPALSTTNMVPASQADLTSFLQDLERRLDALNYWRNDDQKPTMKRNLFNIFTRQNLTTQEIRTLRGMIKVLDEWEKK